MPAQKLLYSCSDIIGITKTANGLFRTKPNFCCVCLNRLLIEHRRNLAVPRDVIQQLLGMNLQSFPALRDSEAVLCHSCELKLNNISKFEKKVACMREEMKEKLSSLDVESTPKRSCYGESSDEPVLESDADRSYMLTAHLRAHC